MRAFPLLLLASIIGIPVKAQNVVIYRCEDAKGRLTLRDSPCEPGETQQSRNMQRPRDPAPKPAPPALASPQPNAAAERTQAPPVIVYRAPPRPMYECVSPDGERYTNETGEGQARWVPFWGYGYAYWPRAGGGSPNRPPPDSRPPPDRPRPPGGVVAVPVGGSWVRDDCHMLPQAETCARLSDRRYEILRRYGSAMPSERRALDLEQRGIDARMANDCGNP